MTRERQCPRCGASRDNQAARCPSCALPADRDEVIAMRFALDHVADAEARRGLLPYQRVGLDLSRRADQSVVTFNGRRYGRRQELERNARELLAQGRRVVEATAAGLQELTVDQDGQLIRTPVAGKRKVTITFDDCPPC